MYAMGIWIPCLKRHGEKVYSGAEIPDWQFRKAREEGAMAVLKGVGELFRLPCHPGSRRIVACLLE
jgi:hypothetical protein